MKDNESSSFDLFSLLIALIKEIRKMTDTQADLDASLNTLIADIGILSTAVAANSAAIAALIAKIGTPPPANLAAEIAQVTQADKSVADAVAAIGAADASIPV